MSSTNSNNKKHCKQHDKKYTYFCIEKSCQANSRISCPQCIIKENGPHFGHKNKEIEEINKIIKLEYNAQPSKEQQYNSKMEGKMLDEIKDSLKEVKKIQEDYSYKMKKIMQEKVKTIFLNKTHPKHYLQGNNDIHYILEKDLQDQVLNNIVEKHILSENTSKTQNHGQPQPIQKQKLDPRNPSDPEPEIQEQQCDLAYKELINQVRGMENSISKHFKDEVKLLKQNFSIIKENFDQNFRVQEFKKTPKLILKRKNDIKFTAFTHSIEGNILFYAESCKTLNGIDYIQKKNLFKKQFDSIITSILPLGQNQLIIGNENGEIGLFNFQHVNREIQFLKIGNKPILNFLNVFSGEESLLKSQQEEKKKLQSESENQNQIENQNQNQNENQNKETEQKMDEEKSSQNENENIVILEDDEEKQNEKQNIPQISQNQNDGIEIEYDPSQDVLIPFTLLIVTSQDNKIVQIKLKNDKLEKIMEYDCIQNEENNIIKENCLSKFNLVQNIEQNQVNLDNIAFVVGQTEYLHVYKLNQKAPIVSEFYIDHSILSLETINYYQFIIVGCSEGVLLAYKFDSQSPKKDEKTSKTQYHLKLLSQQTLDDFNVKKVEKQNEKQDQKQNGEKSEKQEKQEKQEKLSLSQMLEKQHLQKQESETLSSQQQQQQQEYQEFTNEQKAILKLIYLGGGKLILGDGSGTVRFKKIYSHYSKSNQEYKLKIEKVDKIQEFQPHSAQILDLQASSNMSLTTLGDDNSVKVFR
ncbi:WD40-repeat-containing domain [Pseudocohnilembus persalinus]|uniref:WD40-repeat-containing domain n=1 Tax=Pseudocohnilembus persalinus TaxID=266149 RepID=A0A0V0QDT6_PSEPJ|nr:WD40-repeat-containing domain [Pseudocohnilembus persalinus]|eukprot:KRX00354.1 WD40-repeat-containing domain [Pseudocohnilembus persalinus]